MDTNDDLDRVHLDEDEDEERVMLIRGEHIQLNSASCLIINERGKSCWWQ